MDELDRGSTLLHLLFLKIFFPRIKRVTYSLQNIKQPSYYRFWHKVFLFFNCKLIHGAIAATQESEKILTPMFQGPISTIPLGVSPLFFSRGNKQELRQKKSIPTDKTVLIHAGSIHEAKGIDTLIQSSQHLSHLFILLIGTGPLVEELKNTIHPNLKIISPLSPKALTEYYQLSDYVFLGSKTKPYWKEQIGRSLLEGILCGCVAVGSTSGNIPEIIPQSHLLFKENDIDSLTALLKTLPLIDEKQEHQKQSEHVSRHYTWSVVAEQTFHYFNSLS